jgi:hypothetical protein
MSLFPKWKVSTYQYSGSKLFILCQHSTSFGNDGFGELFQIRISTSIRMVIVNPSLMSQ